MSQGVTEVTVTVMIVPIYMSQPKVAEARAPENQIWEAGKLAECIPARKTRTYELGPQPIRFEWKDN
nr:hypothetical protein [Tanacetum cinerariifolium]